MPDEPLVYGLYECYAATTDANLQNIHISHDHFVARNDVDALVEGRKRCAGARYVDVRRICDAEVLG
jgi:hypothetical protein